MNRYLLLSVLLMICVIGSVNSQYCGYSCTDNSGCESPCGQCIEGTCACANSLAACQMRETEFECYDNKTSTCCPQSLSHGNGAVCGSGSTCCMSFSIMTCANATQFCCPFGNYAKACNNGETCCGSEYPVCVTAEEQCCCGETSGFACPSSNTCNCTSNTCVAPTPSTSQVAEEAAPVRATTAPVRATTAPVQATTAPSQCSHNHCGADPCCDDRRAGAQCYSAQYSCMANGDGTSTLCMKQDSVCGGSCYDPDQYDCSSGKLSAHSRNARGVRDENIEGNNLWVQAQAKRSNTEAIMLKFGLPLTGLIGIALAATYIRRRQQKKKTDTLLNENYSDQFINAPKERRASKHAINMNAAPSPSMRLRSSQNMINPAPSSSDLKLSQTFSL